MWEEQVLRQSWCEEEEALLIIEENWLELSLISIVIFKYLDNIVKCVSFQYKSSRNVQTTAAKLVFENKLTTAGRRRTATRHRRTSSSRRCIHLEKRG
jgi:hypothetical protein